MDFTLDSRATELFTTPRKPIPLEGTIPRCPHHVYDPDGRGRAFHCGLCRMQNYGAPTNGFSLPSGASFSDKDRVYANAKQDGCCPECGSRVHYGDGSKWKCADCSHEWKPKRKTEVVVDQPLDMVAA